MNPMSQNPRIHRDVTGARAGWCSAILAGLLALAVGCTQDRDDVKPTASGEPTGAFGSGAGNGGGGRGGASSGGEGGGGDGGMGGGSTTLTMNALFTNAAAANVFDTTVIATQVGTSSQGGLLTQSGVEPGMCDQALLLTTLAPPLEDGTYVIVTTIPSLNQASLQLIETCPTTGETRTWQAETGSVAVSVRDSAYDVSATAVPMGPVFSAGNTASGTFDLDLEATGLPLSP